ncbi:MAG: carbohydrate kinase [Alphaproteobacteria bacterium HGW-Alphaproteobacteria-6]|nr:MAG: carbohydrate kinase [Alphaproteobacteria bacterium HGW-Alphaproteobacteria-6]
MRPRHVAVIDIGKTNVKLALVDLEAPDGPAEVAVLSLPNRVLPGPPWPHFDVAAIRDFALDGLAQLHGAHRIDAIAVASHGACGALLDASGALAAPVLDYEHDGPESTAAAYDAIRPDFAQTGSPRLALGLNLGAQIHWQFLTDPGLGDRVARIVTWPQFWGHLLTGVAACDLSSLGAHSDLWEPAAGRFSALVGRLGIGAVMAPPLRPDAILGPVLPAIAARTGLAPGTPVACGIHDSNASLLTHLLSRDPPFAVVSTGTWVITMAVGGRAVTLDPARDTLINVDARGAPVPSARFMGGREFERICGGAGGAASDADRAEVLDRDLMLLPSVEPHSGPFAGRRSRWTGAGGAAVPDPRPGPRRVAASYYLALMTAECLAMTGAEGPVLIEGPFAQNGDFTAMLRAATARRVLPSAAATGTAIGAALLFRSAGPAPGTVPAVAVSAPPDPRLVAYARRWRRQVDQP